MISSVFLPVIAAALLPTSVVTRRTNTTTAPTVQVRNGTYAGLYNPTYDQDLFLGIPYAQPPTDELRFRPPQSLNTTWNDTRPATAYYNECIGYGSDDWPWTDVVSEDCLALSVIRPHGINSSANLPIVFWLHGGEFAEGGTRDARYNLSYIVQQSVEMQSPIIGVTVNYRLSGWGFLYSEEVAAEGSANLGLRDQRLALYWVQENIASFGGDPSRVTIWGQSAGANSVGLHMVAYNGQNDNIFWGGIAESGAVPSLAAYMSASDSQPYYDAVVNATNCTGASNTLTCLRQVPTATLSSIFNSSLVAGAGYHPVIDGTFLTTSGITNLFTGQFTKTPLLIGTNFDEGTKYAPHSCNTTDQFLSLVQSNGTNYTSALTIASLYPDDPAVGIPGTLHGRPPPSYGYQWKRVAAFLGDLLMHSPRRLTTQSLARWNVTSYVYHWNVMTLGPLDGAAHGYEIPFSFHNYDYLGDEQGNANVTWPQLSTMMSRMWVSFINHLDPNYNNVTNVHWPAYTLDHPRNMVFDVNVTGLAYVEPDTYRAEGIGYITSILQSAFNR
ncbi:cholinesterase [Aspergillus sclerotioniger CBS 115572]|uniref:Carboxylic ester hydrolase n=1 Tax=Aspergillus sclerotioniger CBS 115572 TaxID=1450535 RepID=A0A317WNG4_9EURO|nr:cholinesterase [Aspergillus sclerotioniger CBS 115572]PWY86478.1 cholinesterase [Aspergillus sclerotioniger CBS 115572]